MGNVFLYMHGGSGNKGCEAIVRSTIGILNQKGENKYSLATWSPEEDKKAGLDKLCNLMLANGEVSKKNPLYFLALCMNRFMKMAKPVYKIKYKNFSKRSYEDMIAFSIGGDNYCYSGTDIIKLHHDKVKKEAKKSYLWGCSVEQKSLSQKVINDLKRYDLIFARESITYENLKSAGIDNVKLYPDPAFTLPKEEVPLPVGFAEGNTVGINLSPYAYDGNKVMAKANYIKLIRDILKKTDMQIALIPHVNKNANRDDDYLKEIYDEINSERLVLIKDQQNCMQTKYIISKCRFFIGARTHSTIAAYSSKVPTMVLGYSVKSRGIGKDIFGEEENYVLPVNEFKNESDVSDLFFKMYKNEEKIRNHYDNFMDDYIKKAYSAAEELGDWE